MTTKEKVAASFPAEISVTRPAPSAAAPGRVNAGADALFDKGQADQKAGAEFVRTVVRGAYPAGTEDKETWAAIPMSTALRLIADDVAGHLKGIANLMEKLGTFDDLSPFAEMLEYLAAMSRSQSHLLESAAQAAWNEERAK